MAIRDYWFSTGTPTYLVSLLQHSREQINELAGRYYVPSLFVDYKADVEQPIPMIYQSGYLTIKEYNRRMGTLSLIHISKELLDGKDCPVSELFSRCGFASKSVFYVAFRKVCLLYTSRCV